MDIDTVRKTAFAMPLTSPAYRQMLDKYFMQPGTGMGAEFARQVRADYDNNRRVIRENNIQAD